MTIAEQRKQQAVRFAQFRAAEATAKAAFLERMKKGKKGKNRRAADYQKIPNNPQQEAPALPGVRDTKRQGP